ncbi:sugar kinase [Kutzneria sp. NPDC052558]|uniref:sugar kinase n=1 Tax=Kutzneria sp. NPDC052558 TaxID=3364121 RepID=UPI0037CA3BCA
MERQEVVCLGESMALFVPAQPGPVHEARAWTLSVGGAESNVASHLARAGFHARWVSALGDDSLGRAVRDRIAGVGVDVTDVRTDPVRPTGLYVKEASADGSPVRYYRRGSAASGMGPELLATVGAGKTALVHISGITAALSSSCLDLLWAVLALPLRVSFDVNWRPALWTELDKGVLRELADRADIVFVGDDEAEAVWGVSAVEDIRSLLPNPAEIVVKHGARGATLLTDSEPVFESALKVDVVEPVGAGDAFAAGFLAADLNGESVRRRLRRGHLTAAGVLLTAEDLGEPLPEDVVAKLLDADDATWSGAYVTAGGVILP